MAECLLILGKYDEGITKAKAAVQIAPDNWYDQLALARLYFMKENYDEALEWSARSSEMGAPGLWRTDERWWHAWYLVWLGRLSEAEQDLAHSEQKAQREYGNKRIEASDRDDILGGIGWLRAWCAYEKGDWKRSRLYLSQWAKLTDSRWFSQFCLGLVDLQQGKIDSIAMRLQRLKDTFMTFSRSDTASSRRYEDNLRYFGSALKAASLFAEHRSPEMEPNSIPWRTWLTQLNDPRLTASWPIFAPSKRDWGAVATIRWIPIPFDIFPRAYVERLGQRMRA